MITRTPRMTRIRDWMSSRGTVPGRDSFVHFRASSWLPRLGLRLAQMSDRQMSDAGVQKPETRRRAYRLPAYRLV